MSATTRLRYDDLQGAAGLDLGTTDWHTVPKSDVLAFADLTGDHQWIHIDDERAKQGPFGTTVVHGFFTLSLLPFFLDQLLEVTEISMGVNYGLDKVRFPSIVPVGGRLRGRASIVGVAAAGDGRTHVTVRMEFLTEVSDRPACVADLVAMFCR